MKKVLVAAVAVLMLLKTAPAVMAGLPPQPLQFGSHVVASCDVQPDQVEVRLQNQMTVNVLITGEIWAQPTGGSAVLISSVPTQFQAVTPNNWGGPEQRMGIPFPGGFNGNVWGWAEIRALDGTLIGREELSAVNLNCGPAAPPKPPFEFGNHVAVSCGVQPDQVEVRIQNQMTGDIQVTGKLWAQPAGGNATLIASVPAQYQTVPPGAWGGPEERVGNAFPGGFTGSVWGFAQIQTTGGVLLGKTTLASIPITCPAMPPTLTPTRTATATATPTATPTRTPSPTPKVFKEFLPFVAKPAPPQTCADLTMWVYSPNSPAVQKPFGVKPGPTYSFGNAFVAGQTVRFATGSGQFVDTSYLGWFNFYTRATGVGPVWNLAATDFTGDPPLLAILYTWQAAKTLPNGTQCSIGFLLQWDPPS